jgi:branched-chain amino acid transport system permease protein
MAQLRINPPSAFDPQWANIAIFIVMVGGIGSIEGVLIGALIYFFADRMFGEYGATYLIMLGLLTLVMALFARGGVWGMICRVVDAPWFPIRRMLLNDKGGM